jgi:hypothetical protein
MSQIRAGLEHLNQGDRVRVLQFIEFIRQSRQGKRQARRQRFEKIPSE